MVLITANTDNKGDERDGSKRNEKKERVFRREMIELIKSESQLIKETRGQILLAFLQQLGFNTQFRQRLNTELISDLTTGGQENVIEHDGISHGPQLKAEAHDVREAGRSRVIKVVRVGDLAGLPLADVSGVGDERGGPGPFVVGIGDLAGLPGAAAAGQAGRVGDARRFPVAVQLQVPFFGLMGVGIRDGFFVDPVGGLAVGGVNEPQGRRFVPVVWLGGFGVGDHLVVHPVGGFEVLRIVNERWWVDGRFKVFEQRSFSDEIVVDEDLVAVVFRFEVQGVHVSQEIGGEGRERSQGFFFPFECDGVLPLEDEMQLGIRSTFIRTKHDSIRSLAIQSTRVELARFLRLLFSIGITIITIMLATIIRGTEKLEISTSAFQKMLGANFKLHDQVGVRAGRDGNWHRNTMVAGHTANHQAHVIEISAQPFIHSFADVPLPVVLRFAAFDPSVLLQTLLEVFEEQVRTVRLWIEILWLANTHATKETADQDCQDADPKQT